MENWILTTSRERRGREGRGREGEREGEGGDCVVVGSGTLCDNPSL